MMSSRLPVSVLVWAALLTALAAGCSASGSSGTAGVPVLPKAGNLEKTTLNVAVLANLDSAGFFVALHEGLSAQEGLRINYSPAFSDSIIGTQAKGQYDITGMNYVSYIEAQVHHVADLRIFAEGSLLQTGSDVIMVMPHSRIQSLQDLRGHMLGVNTTANIGFLLVASILSEEGSA
jgi:ABC-type nitrate/sulfonate/bicarbonate transport system substrate-binding protein